MKIYLIFLLVCKVLCEEYNPSPLNIPRSFIATVNVITQKNDGYPPNSNTYKVYYDYNKKVARADMISGFEKNITYIRRYDKEWEYKISGQFKEYVEMPKPQFPYFDIKKMPDTELIGEYVCDHYVLSTENNEMHFYQDKQLNMVVRVCEYYKVGDKFEPTISYTLNDIKIGEINFDKNIFEIETFGYTHSQCEFDKLGFPFLDVLHYYVSF